MTLIDILDTWMKRSQAEDRAPQLRQMLLDAGWKEPAVAPTPDPTPTPTPEPTPAPTPPPSGRTVIWKAGHETDLNEWGGSAQAGGGLYPSGGGVHSRSTEQKHSGVASMKFAIAPSGGSSACRAFRWAESRTRREAYYSAWFFIPQNFTLTADPSQGRYWDLFQFKSRISNYVDTQGVSRGARNDPFWLFAVKEPEHYLYAGWGWGGMPLPGPRSTDGIGGKNFDSLTKTPVPIGRWFKLEAFLRQSKDFDGVVKMWQDGVLVFDFPNVRTGFDSSGAAWDNAWHCNDEWAACSYSDGINPSPFSIYVDDAEIGVMGATTPHD